MPDYTVYIKASAQKELDDFNDVLFERLRNKISTLAVAPRPSGAKKLKGSKESWRIRIGDYRVIYVIDDAHKRIEIIRVAHRKEVYD